MAEAGVQSIVVLGVDFMSENVRAVVDAAGYAKVGLTFENLSMHYNDTPALENGRPIVKNKSRWKEIVSAKEFTITLNLNQGKASGEIWTNDLSEEYVNFNKSE